MPKDELELLDDSNAYATKRDINKLARMVLQNDYRLQRTEKKVNELHETKVLLDKVAEDVSELMRIWNPVKGTGIVARVFFVGLKWLLGLAIMVSALYAALRGQ